MKCFFVAIKRLVLCALGCHEYEERHWSFGFTKNGTLVGMRGWECKHCGHESLTSTE